MNGKTKHSRRALLISTASLIASSLAVAQAVCNWNDDDCDSRFGSSIGGATGGNPPALAPGKPRAATVAVQPRILATVGNWLSWELGYPAVAELPKVVLAPPQRLSAMRSVGAAPATLPQAAGPQTPPDIAAFYNDAERTINLPLGRSGATPAEVSILVHEMVHHIQNVAGMNYPCPEAREAPAFAAQAAWLARSGMDLLAAFGIDPLTLLVRTKCLH
jgi:hypothetical protein